MKIGLGTVQFGLDYGISNKTGKTNLSEVKEILHSAYLSGIDTIDTARGYGNSEEILGEVLPSDEFNIVTKIGTKFPDMDIRNSLTALKRSSIYAVLFHSARDVIQTGIKDCFRRMQAFKDEGLVRKIGISVYDPEELDAILNEAKIDIVQLPLNIFDQRFYNGGYLKKLKDMGIKIHTRSMFLQGVLLMEPDELPVYFRPYRNLITSYRQTICEEGLGFEEAPLLFLKNIPEIDRIIMGINTNKQLCENISYWNSGKKFSAARFASTDPMLIIPSNWKLNS